jgi:beta-glucosidase
MRICLLHLWEFGYGLGLYNFDYSNLTIKPEVNGPEGEFHVSLDVTNTGKRSGAEVVQLYIRDVISSVTRPVKELKGFKKVRLEPGENKKVEFIVGPEQLSFLDRNLNKVVEPGAFEVMVGSSSENIRLRGELKVK